jgi:hypothetical protein|tara:strand:- start:5118 stop:5477 length:360 start_codon:yes stop_codon:yes gene_type:complete
VSNIRFSPEELRSRASSQGVTIPESVMGLHKKNPQFGGMIGLLDIMFMKKGWTDTTSGKKHAPGTSFLATGLSNIKEKNPEHFTTLTGITPQQKVSQLSQPKPRQTFGDAVITQRSLLG